MYDRHGLMTVTRKMHDHLQLQIRLSWPMQLPRYTDYTEPRYTYPQPLQLYSQKTPPLRWCDGFSQLIIMFI